MERDGEVEERILSFSNSRKETGKVLNMPCNFPIRGYGNMDQALPRISRTC